MQKENSLADKTAVIEALGSRSADVRERAVEALAHFRFRGVGRLLAGAARDPSRYVRARVAETLGHYAGPDVTKLLEGLLRDADEVVRINAAQSLGTLKSQCSARHLRWLLERDPKPLVRAYAAEALGTIGDRGHVETLEQALNTERSWAVRLRIVMALYRLGQRNRWRQVGEFLRARDYRVRCAAIAAMENLASPSRKEYVRAVLLEHRDVERIAAVLSDLDAALASL